MNKTLLASAIAMSLGSAASAQAATITITDMDFGKVYAATGTMNSAGNGSMNSVDPFSIGHGQLHRKTGLILTPPLRHGLVVRALVLLVPSVTLST